MNDAGALRRFRLPDLGEGLIEAEVVTWRVALGDEVALNQVLLEVETEKAVVELPSPYAGRVVELLAADGETVAVGAPLVAIEVARTPDDGDQGDPGDDADRTHVDGAPRVPTLVGYGPSAPAASRRRGRRPQRVHDQAAPRAAATPGNRPLAAPPVRFMARQRGVDLARVSGHGPNGLITREDLAAHLAVTESPSVGTESTRETREPAHGLRKRMAEAMVASVTDAPQASVFHTIDATRTLQLVARLRQNRRFEELTVTPLTVVARAVVVALGEHPALNSSWDGATDEIVTKHYVNLGIAVAGPRGLVVPNIKDAQDRSFRELAVALGALTDRARADRCAPEVLRGGSFTLTNVGVFGVDAGVPLLNPGEAGILALGAVQRRPWEHDDEVALRDVVTLTLTFDHRLVDGQQAATFLTAVGEIVADPTHLLAFG